ncbi:hypothetical protein OIDMADRAFT_60850 [Oidiodendron maius Zn]|uniref:Pyrroline-5-carboxylate reductase n=1 Tax=Oidiodendron maius (strain Zn) TaxID=913774 RepID=A0A0C3GRN2_OIDMZ|nr:hypothetical protein OIDMADRAFT_60850 [Oidiodendron maius Zn]
MTPTSIQSPGFTLAIIGCGKLGVAVIQGILEPRRHRDIEAPQHNSRTLELVIASVRTREKSELLSEKFLVHLQDKACPLELVVGNNIDAARRADVIVLTCHPHQASEILGAQGMPEALAGKLLVSMLGGVSVAALEEAIYVTPGRAPPGQHPCHIVQAIANAAAARKRSITVVADKSTGMPDEDLELAMDVLGRIGDIAFVTVDQMPAATALCASGTAFFAWFLEAVIEGAVADGIDRTEASRMAALTMAGAAELVVSGEDAATVRAKVTSPGGVTAVGLAVMEQSKAKATVIKALRTTASRLGSKSR